MPDLTQLKEFKNGDILDASELNAMVDQIETKAEESTVAELTAKVNNLETTINKVDISSFASKQDIVDSLSAHTATADNSYFRKEDAVIPIANGGTGATTVQDALDNLHVYSCDNTYHREEICTNDTLHLFGCEIPNNIFEQIGGYWWKRRTEEVGESYTLTSESIEQSFLTGFGESTPRETVLHTIYFSTSNTDEKFTVNSDNTFTFNNYLSINWTVGNGDEVKEAIAGKYYMVKDTSDAEPIDSVIYFAGDVAGDSTYFNIVTIAPFYGVTGGGNGGASGTEKTINCYIANATKYTAEWKSYTTLGAYEYVHCTNRNAYPDSGKHGLFSYYYLGVPFKNAIEPTHIKKFSYVGDDNWGESKPTVYTADFDIKAVIVNRHHLSVDTDPDTGASKTNNANIYLTDIEIKRSGSSSPLSVRFEGNCVRLWTSENYPATQYNDADYEYTVVLLG